ncbi:MAG: hypothetical protein JNM33_18645 [Rubrivivax sp.]|nr:hypothetical protein [Rubrivivax sp.]
MTGPNDLAKLVPGFDFLQNLMKGSGLPGVQGFGQWIAPTLDPEELDKRIQELKTVQFWLEQNARLLGTTVQALEVQRMTLSTLQTMNLPMTELRDALKARPAAPPPAPEPEPEPEAAAEPPAPKPAAPRKPKAAADKPAAPAIDPMQWWGALTQQFTEIAGKALKEGAGGTLRAAASAPVKAAKVAKAAVKPARRPARKSGA